MDSGSPLSSLARSRSRACCWWAGVLLLVAIPAAWSDGPKPAKPEPRPKPDRPGELTPQERQRLDAVLAEAWKDQAVIEAREEVHAATDQYRKALRDAVKRIDPAAVPLMGKLHDKSRVEAMRRKFPLEGPPGMGPPLPEDPAASIQVLATQEANLRQLEGPNRDRFFTLAHQIHDQGTLKPQIRKTYESWTRGGRDASKARRELREQFLAEMRKQDPWAADLLQSDPLQKPTEAREAESLPPPPPSAAPQQ